MGSRHFVLELVIVVMVVFVIYCTPGLCSVTLSTFRSLYIRMPDLQLSAPPSRFLYNATTELCAQTCVEEVTFDCRSFDLDHLHRTCLLFNQSYEDGKAYLQESSYVDHYRSAFEKLFNRLPNHVITVAHKRKVPGLSVERCARRCIFEMSFRCKGFDYEPQQRNCWMTDLSVETSGAGVKYHNGADFYERILDGPLSRFVNYGTGSLPLPDGYQIYNKVMFGLTLGACAQLCLTQTTFECASFDFSFSDKSCHMSEYMAADLNGLNHDVMPTYKVMHYEKKGEYVDYFYPTPYTIVLGRNDKTLQAVSADKCARQCLQEQDFICRSFDYQIRNGTCLLSSTTGSDVGSLYYQGQAQAHHFEMKPFLDCGGVLTQQQGIFASPNWPRNYEHNLNCTWHVRVTKYKVITFDFSHFDLGPRHSNPCDLANDRLIISEMASHGPVRFCATSPMTSYVSHSHEVTLQFISTNRVDAPGFSVYYNGDWPCNAVLTEDRGQLASPSWPRQYPPSLQCQWTLRAPLPARLALHFSAIDLDGHGFGKCTDRYDVIKIYDGDSTASPLLGMLCGHDPVTSYTSRHNVLVVTFKTDAHVQRTGFHATYSFLYPPTTTGATTTTTTPTPTTRANRGSNVTVTAPTASYTRGLGTTKGAGDVIYRLTSLTAQFVEPAHDVKHDWGFSSPLPLNTTSRYPLPEGEDGGGYAGPDVNSRDLQVPETFVHTMWALVTSLLLMLLLMLLVLLMVCRHYRKRSPKRRNIPNYTFTEENLSLYEKDTLASVSTQNMETSTYKFHSDPDPEIAFSNPLYESRYPPPSLAASRRTSMSTLTSFSRC